MKKVCRFLSTLFLSPWQVRDAKNVDDVHAVEIGAGSRKVFYRVFWSDYHSLQLEDGHCLSSTYNLLMAGTSALCERGPAVESVHDFAARLHRQRLPRLRKVQAAHKKPWLRWKAMINPGKYIVTARGHAWGLFLFV
jgi:hypothetical protein